MHESPAANANTRRLRWALVLAVALHALLFWRYLPNLTARFEAMREAMNAPEETVVEIAPPPPPPPPVTRGMTLATRLGEAGVLTEKDLPKNFFDKPKGLAGGRMMISDNLDFSRQSGIQVVASIVPGALRLSGVNALSDAPRAPAPRPGQKPAATPAPAVKKPTATQPAPAPSAQPRLSPPLPATAAVEADAVPSFLLPAPEPEPAPAVPDLDVDAVIARAADDAERTAREVQRRSDDKTAPNYRALLASQMRSAVPQTPLDALPRESAGAPESAGGITTYALDAPAAPDRQHAAPEEGPRANAARQQFFAQLTARLKATNNRLLAESMKAGQRTTVRMTFLLDRDGRVLSISPGDPVARELVERAAAVIRATALPPVPASMTEVPVELSFPVEVYR